MKVNAEAGSKPNQANLNIDVEERIITVDELLEAQDNGSLKEIFSFATSIFLTSTAEFFLILLIFSINGA